MCLIFVACEFLFVYSDWTTAGTGYVLMKAHESFPKVMKFGLPIVLISTFVPAMIFYGLGRFVFQQSSQQYIKNLRWFKMVKVLEKMDGSDSEDRLVLL